MMSGEPFSSESLFADVQRKAYMNGVELTDDRMHELASYFTGGRHTTYYLGQELNSEIDHVDYSLLEWKTQEAAKTAICIRTVDAGKKPGYMFFVFDAEKTKLELIHSTEKPTKNQNLGGEMGTTYVGKEDSFIGPNSLISAMMADI